MVLKYECLFHINIEEKSSNNEKQDCYKRLYQNRFKRIAIVLILLLSRPEIVTRKKTLFLLEIILASYHIPTIYYHPKHQNQILDLEIYRTVQVCVFGYNQY